MELIRGLHNIRRQHAGCVATIGNFDGVHLGHQAVLGLVSDKAADFGLPSLAIIFEPQPLEVFRPEIVPPRLMRMREKVEALRRYAVDRVLCIRFDDHFSAMTAEDFVNKVLIGGLGLRYLVVGDDFRFGKDRAGDFAMLKAAGEAHGFPVVHMSSFRIDGARVSSTLVRAALGRGDMEGAEALLGRPFRMSGRVAHGNKIGRTLGIPTANIYLHRLRVPLAGIYMVEVYGLDGEPLMGAASVGTRPTVGGTRTLLEIHLLDFEGEIYGQHLHVDFLHKIRDEEKYDTMDALKARIEEDIRLTRAWFAANNARNEHHE